MNRMKLDVETLAVESYSPASEVTLMAEGDSVSACPTGCACCTG